MTMTRHRIRRYVAAAILSLTALGITTATGTAASAEEPRILVSDDGVTFAPTLTSALFDDLGMLIPLASIESSLWVQNTATTDGSLRLRVNELASASEVFSHSVTLTAMSGNKAWTSTLDELATCDSVIPTLPIPAGKTVRVDLVLAMADVDGLTAQDESANLAFVVDMRDAQYAFPAQACAQAGNGDAVFPGDALPGDGALPGEGALPRTGADFIPTAALSLGLLYGGLIILLARRRRRSEES